MRGLKGKNVLVNPVFPSGGVDHQVRVRGRVEFSDGSRWHEVAPRARVDDLPDGRVTTVHHRPQPRLGAP